MERVDELQNHLKTARFFLSRRQYERSANAAQKALTVDPNCAEGYAIRAICAARLGKGAEARREADLALKQEPGNVYNFYASVVAAQCESDYERGEADARRGLEIAPEYAYLHYRLGQIFEAQSLFEAARDSFAEAIRLVPENTDYQLSIAQLLFSKKEWDAGNPYLQETLRLAPENAQAHKALGRMHVKNGQSQAALKAFRVSLELYPNDVFVQRYVLYLESSQHPFFRLFKETRRFISVRVDEVSFVWTGLGRPPYVFGGLALAICLIEKAPTLLKGFFYLQFCLWTVLEIYHFVASEILWRKRPDKKGRPTLGQRGRMLFIAASYALMHFLYWWLPTVL